jgi:hypothetical protein
MSTTATKELKTTVADERLSGGLNQLLTEHYRLVRSERIKEGIKARKQAACLVKNSKV